MIQCIYTRAGLCDQRSSMLNILNDMMSSTTEKGDKHMKKNTKIVVAIATMAAMAAMLIGCSVPNGSDIFKKGVDVATDNFSFTDTGVQLENITNVELYKNGMYRLATSDGMFHLYSSNSRNAIVSDEKIMSENSETLFAVSTDISSSGSSSVDVYAANGKITSVTYLQWIAVVNISGNKNIIGTHLIVVDDLGNASLSDAVSGSSKYVASSDDVKLDDNHILTIEGNLYYGDTSAEPSFLRNVNDKMIEKLKLPENNEISIFTLSNHNKLIQVYIKADRYGDDYDLIDTSGYKYNVITYVYNILDDKLKEIDSDYLFEKVDNSVINEDYNKYFIATDMVLGYEIIDRNKAGFGTIMTMDSDSGATSIAIERNATNLPIKVSSDHFAIELSNNKIELLNLDGSTVNVVDGGNMRSIIPNKGYMDGRNLYNFDGSLLESFYGYSNVEINQNGTAYMNDGMEKVMWNGGQFIQLEGYNELNGYIFTTEVNGSTTYFNSYDGTVIATSSSTSFLGHSYDGSTIIVIEGSVYLGRNETKVA